ncbi:MAG: hypothetical protein HY974_01615, partial [Candidatus Kerfeldbacteria bacterium]|nr:hypothetical protein [Candidatus Kerfeldbacteria bacterium]
MPDFAKVPPAERLPAAEPETKEQIGPSSLERGLEIKPEGVARPEEAAAQAAAV